MINEKMYALGANRSCIRELFEYGRQRAAIVGPENVLDFSLGNPSMPCPQGVTDAIRDIAANMDPVRLHGYTSAVGDLACRQAIADDLNHRFQANAKAEEFFITCGAAPALTAVFRALAYPGAEILALAPFFPEYRPFVEGAGCTFGVVAPKLPDLKLNLPAIEAALTPNTAAINLNNPNNPSGVLTGAEELAQLARILTAKEQEFGHPIYIISDEPYRELVYGGAEYPWLPHIYPDTVVCYSYSKSLSLPGERLGYVYVPGTVIEGKALYTAIAGAARAMGHVCAPSLWQQVISRCTGLRPDLQAYDRNRRMLVDALTDMGYTLAIPEGAFYVFVKIPNEGFLEKAQARDLLLVPGDGFGCPGYFRMCYCVEPGKVEKALPILRELLG